MRDRPDVRELAKIRLRPKAKIALDFLISIYPRTVPTSRLVDIIYADDPNGGPDSGRRAVSVHLCHANEHLAASGWRMGAAAKGRRSDIGLREI